MKARHPSEGWFQGKLKGSPKTSFFLGPFFLNVDKIPTPSGCFGAEEPPLFPRFVEGWGFPIKKGGELSTQLGKGHRIISFFESLIVCGLQKATTCVETKRSFDARF